MLVGDAGGLVLLAAITKAEACIIYQIESGPPATRANQIRGEIKAFRSRPEQVGEDGKIHAAVLAKARHVVSTGGKK